MTDQANLERAYRRLLAAYPREFRRENGPEILAVLLAGAADGKHRPGLAEAADLIRSGLWMRLRPGVPRSARTVRAAVKVMYAGAAVSTASLVILLALVGDIGARHAILRYHLSAAQASQALNPLGITVAVAVALVPVGLWVWMARETGRGRNWARGLSTVLFGLATLSLSSVFAISAIKLTFVPTVNLSFVPALGPAIIVLTWLAAWPRCGCCGARPPPRSSSRRITPGPGTRRRWPNSTIRCSWPNSRGSGHGCRGRCEGGEPGCLRSA